MRKLIGFAALMLVSGVASMMLAGPVSARPTSASATKLIVAMHDPGCHWFYTNGKYTKSTVRHGAVKLVNLDEKTLIIKGPGGTKLDKVGGSVTLTAKGVYRIAMVKQASDDNHLKLTIK